MHDSIMLLHSLLKMCTGKNDLERKLQQSALQWTGGTNLNLIAGVESRTQNQH